MGAIVSKLAFQPPSQRIASVERMNGLLQQQPGYEMLQTASGVSVPLVCVMPRGVRPSDVSLCLLVSHGNAEDLGETLPFLHRLAEHVRLPVLGFDYPGYGLASACEPSEQGCFEAAEAAYAHVSRRWPGWRIVLCGRSLGSGPAVFMAEQRQRAGGAELAGLILLSPLCSGSWLRLELTGSAGGTRRAERCSRCGVCRSAWRFAQASQRRSALSRGCSAPLT